jgi:hypothetical protein
VCESEDLRARPVQISWLVDYVVAILLDKLQRKPGAGNQVGVDRESGEGFALYQGTTSVGPLRRNKIKGFSPCTAAFARHVYLRVSCTIGPHRG